MSVPVLNRVIAAMNTAVPTRPSTTAAAKTAKLMSC